MQQSIGRWIVLAVVAIGILFASSLIQRAIWPPKEKDDKKDDISKKEEKKGKPVERDAIRYLALDLAGGGVTRDPLSWLCWLTLEGKDLKPLPADPRPIEWRYLPPERQAAFLLSVAPAASPYAFFPGLASSLNYLEPPVTEVTLGGAGYFIEAKLTSRGAGVRQLTLTQFEAANYLGKRVKGEKLELIQDDPYVASFLMYHYPDADVKPSDAPAKAPVLNLGLANWQLVDNKKDSGGTQRVTFATPLGDPNYPDYVITKTYELSPKAYHLGLVIDIANRGPPDKDKTAKPRAFRYQLAGSHGMPLEGEWYAPTQRDALIGLVDDRHNVDRDKQDVRTITFRDGGDAVPSIPGGLSSEYFLRYAGVAIQFFASTIAVDDDDGRGVLAWARPTLESHEVAGVIVEVEEHHLEFAVKKGDKGVLEGFSMLPRTVKHLKEANLNKGDKAVLSYYQAPDGRKIATWIRPGNTPRDQFNDITVRVNSEKVEVPPGKSVKHRFVLYHGPVKTRLLGQFSGDEAVPPELVEKYTDKLELYTLTDYRSQGFFGALSQKIMFTNLLIGVTNLMHTLLYWLHFLVGSYGLAIILLTVLVRGMMFPISRRQAQFSIKMQALAPELKKLQEKYKADPRAKTQATMEFYRKHKINPFASCLPLLLQMPIFLGLYFALQESIHFRLAGFLWIENLAAPDMLLYWTQSLPWISDPDNVGGFFYLGPYFNLLPLCAVALMVVQQKMMAPPAMDEQQAMQMKIMKFMMIFMGIIFYKVAAGLALYFIASSLWGVAERKLLPKKTDTALPQPGQPPAPGKFPTYKGAKTKKEPPKPEPTGILAGIKKWWQEVLEEAKKKK